MSLRVMVELRLSGGTAAPDLDSLLSLSRELGLTPDPDLDPVPMAGTPENGSKGGPSVIISGTVPDRRTLEALRRDPRVIEVWNDTPIEPFGP